jgi:hypothetical protein
VQAYRWRKELEYEGLKLDQAKQTQMQMRHLEKEDCAATVRPVDWWRSCREKQVLKDVAEGGF